jgi:hypothetical protein
MKFFSARNKYLWSFLFFWLLSLSVFATEECTELRTPVFETLRYRASIDVLDKHLSGILIFKTTEDSSIRVVMINEMGATFFDMSFTNSDYTFNSIMESLDKKAVKRTFAKDLGMLLYRGIFKSNSSKRTTNNSFEVKLKRKGTVKYHLGAACNQFISIENFGKRKKVVSINNEFNEQDFSPSHIFVQHHTVRFTIQLTRIYDSE